MQTSAIANMFKQMNGAGDEGERPAYGQVVAMADTLRGASGEPLVRSTYISSAAPLPRDCPDLVAATPSGLMAATQEYGQFSGWHWTKAGIVTRCAHTAAEHVPAPMRCGLVFPTSLCGGQVWGIFLTRGPSGMAACITFVLVIARCEARSFWGSTGFILRGSIVCCCTHWVNTSMHRLASKI